MKNIKILLGSCRFIDNSKQYYDISKYVENKEISIDLSANNLIPTASQIELTIFDSESIMKDDLQLKNFILENKDISRFSLLIFYNNKIIYNGVVELFNLKIPNNFKYSNDKPFSYSINTIHKASELKQKFISKLLSYRQVNILNYFNYLFETNTRITKYVNYDDETSTLLDVKWGNDYAPLYEWQSTNNTNVFWGYSIYSTEPFKRIYLDKDKVYNYKTVSLGDALHVFNSINGTYKRDSYVIKSIKLFAEKTNQLFVESFSIDNQDSLIYDIFVTIDNSYNATLTSNGIVIGTGIYNSTTNEIVFTGINNGRIGLKPEFKEHYLKYYSTIWGQLNENLIWGLDGELTWGCQLVLNVNQLLIETFEDIAVYGTSDSTKIVLGYHFDSFDDAGIIDVANPIVKFTDALTLLDNLSNDYGFNYNIDNYGHITLYTNSKEDSKAEEYVLQIGNSPDEMTLNCSTIKDNCKIFDSSNIEVLNITSDIKDLTIKPNLVINPYSCKFRMSNLTVGKKYKLSLDVNSSNVFIYWNDTNEVILTELDYYDTPTFSFVVPNGCTTVDVMLTGNVGKTQIDVNSISVKDFTYTDSEYDSIFQPIEIKTDASGISTAVYMTGFEEKDYTETVEKINIISPARNTWHKINDDITEANKTISTASGETKYIKFGQGISQINFPVLISEDSFVNSIKLNVYRNTLVSSNAILVSFLRDNSEVIFNQIIPQSQISTNIQISPTFLYKSSDSKLECILQMKNYDTSRIITNNKFTTTNENWYVIGEKVKIVQGTQLLEYTISDKVANEITLSGGTIANLTTDIIVNKDNSLSGTYAEIESTVVFSDSNDYIILDGVLNSSLALIRETGIQNSYVWRLPVFNTSKSVAESPDIMQLKITDTTTDTFSVVDIASNIQKGKDFIANNSDYFQKLLQYDLVYIDIFDYSSNEWKTHRLKSFNATSGTITLWDSVNLTNYAENGLAQFRRLYITKTLDFGAKPTDDLYHEAYITTSRTSFGFNDTVDREAIELLIKDDPSKTKGKIYLLNNMLGASYNVTLSYPRRLESDKADDYGILETYNSDTIKDLDTFIIKSEQELLYNAKPVVNTTVKIHLDYFSKICPTVDLQKVRICKIYSPLFDGYKLYSIENKSYSFNKSNINILTLDLEELV